MKDDQIVDEVAVERAVKGDRSVNLNRAEAWAAWQELERKKLSASDIGARLGVAGRTVVRWRTGEAHPISRRAVRLSRAGAA